MKHNTKLKEGAIEAKLSQVSSDKEEPIESISGCLLKATQAMRGAYEEVDYVYPAMIGIEAINTSCEDRTEMANLCRTENLIVVDSFVQV